jgi:hypothetical protein
MLISKVRVAVGGVEKKIYIINTSKIKIQSMQMR